MLSADPDSFQASAIPSMKFEAKKLLVFAWMEAMYPQFTGQIFSCAARIFRPANAYTLPVLIRWPANGLPGYAKSQIICYTYN